MNLITPKVGAKCEHLFNELREKLRWFCQISKLDLNSKSNVTKIIPMMSLNGVTPKAGAKHEGFFNMLRLVC
jgi:hypothetical protein